MKLVIIRFMGIAILGIILALGTASISISATDGVTGNWKTIDDNTGKVKSVVKIWINKKNGKLYGRVIKLINPKEKNPKCDKCKGRMKNKLVKGMVILWGLKKGSDEWKDGWILDPENGKTYDCKIWRDGKKLQVRGYIAFFYRTQTWIR